MKGHDLFFFFFFPLPALQFLSFFPSTALKKEKKRRPPLATVQSKEDTGATVAVTSLYGLDSGLKVNLQCLFCICREMQRSSRKYCFLQELTFLKSSILFISKFLSLPLESHRILQGVLHPPESQDLNIEWLTRPKHCSASLCLRYPQSVLAGGVP